MKRKKLKNGKDGSTVLIFAITIMTTLTFILLFIVIIFKIQISSKITYVKKDLFYIAQNGALALDTKSLSYNEYIMNQNKLKQYINEIINKNYDGEVELIDVYYDYSKNLVKINVNLSIKPIIKVGGISVIKVPIYEEVKLKLMEVSYI